MNYRTLNALQKVASKLRKVADDLPKPTDKGYWGNLYVRDTNAIGQPLKSFWDTARGKKFTPQEYYNKITNTWEAKHPSVVLPRELRTFSDDSTITAQGLTDIRRRQAQEWLGKHGYKQGTPKYNAGLRFLMKSGLRNFGESTTNDFPQGDDVRTSANPERSRPYENRYLVDIPDEFRDNEDEAEKLMLQGGVMANNRRRNPNIQPA